MNDMHSNKLTLSMAEHVGIVALLIGGVLFFFDARLAIIPLGIYLALCMIAPFLPGFGFFLPIISRGKSGKRAVSVTFDDGPDPLTTPELLGLLLRHNIKATFFVLGKKAAEHPELIKDIISRGHSVGNHSYTHDRFIMLKSIGALRKDIESTQQVLEGLGIRPLLFRPPEGITNPRLRNVLLELGMDCVNFSCRGIEGGNRRINRLSERILRRIGPGDIIMLHDIRPWKEGLFPYWLNEMDLIFSGIKARGFSVIPLNKLIEKPVMIKGIESEGEIHD